MHIGLLDTDGHNFPNLALMKISAGYKRHGHTVEWRTALDHYDVVYQSKVFTFTPDTDVYNADAVIRGGTGYGTSGKLPDEIEHMMPDYGLYGIKDTAYGFLTRGCPRNCAFCVVSGKEGGRSVKAADLSEWWDGQAGIELMDPNLLACREHLELLNQLAESGARVNFNQGLDCRLLNEDNIRMLNKIKIKNIHFAWDLMPQTEDVLKGLREYAQYAERKPHGSYAAVYVLVNYNTSAEEDLYRIYKLREMKYDPYVMIYDKINAPVTAKHMARWVNNKRVWRSCGRFEDYDVKKE